MFNPLQFFDEMGLMKNASWSHWRTVISAIYGIGVGDVEAFKKLTGRSELPTKPFDEVWCISSRRSGKSYACAALAIVTALFGEFETLVAPGERPWIFVVSSDKLQCQIILDYCRGLLEPFEDAVESVTKDEIRFVNRNVISIRSASIRTMRGYSTSLVLLDEAAHYRDKEGVANPVRSIVGSLQPTLLPGGKLIAISSPWERGGYLFKTFKEFYGQNNNDVLVINSTSKYLNPTLDDKKIEKALRRDPVAAASEWLGQFRSDLESYCSYETLEQSTGPFTSRAYEPGKEYVGFVDCSGGSRDRYTAAVAHVENGKIIVDRLFAADPPFNPEAVTEDVVKFLGEYKIFKVTGDSYSAGWVSNAFLKRNVIYEKSAWSKSEIYIQALAMLNSNLVELIKDQTLFDEIIGLERRSKSGGADTVDHAPGGTDDKSNSVLGAVVLAKHRLAEAPTDKELEARMPSFKRHPKTTRQQDIRDFNRDFAREFGLAVPANRMRRFR